MKSELDEISLKIVRKIVGKLNFGVGTSEIPEEWEIPLIKSVKEEICELALCEIEMLALRPHQLYLFYVIEDCKRCVELEKKYEN